MEKLTVTEAAERARCHPETVRAALRAGDLRGTQRVKGGNWLIPVAALNAWMKWDEEAVAA